MSGRVWILALAAAVPLLVGEARADNKPKTKEVVSFGQLKAPPAEMARAQALDWLKTTGKVNDAAFTAIWAEADRPLLDRVADTLALGDADAAKLLTEVRNSTAPALTELPAVLRDAKKPVFFRANLALAAARAMCQRRVYEEALETLKLAKPEQVVDPAAYLFHRAVAEHALLKKDDASRSLTRLLDDTADAPERYRMVATLMQLDMQSWKDKSLDTIARKMDNVDRRLQLARGGPHTQKLQKEIVSRLDELIKQMENQANRSSDPNGGSCPNGGQPGGQPGAQGPIPQDDSRGGTNSGPGNVDKKKLDGLAKQWGKLPEKERAKAMQELTRDLPPEYRELIEAYFRKLAQTENKP